MAIFVKRNGSWFIKGTGLSEGAEVSVTKRDRSVSVVRCEVIIEEVDGEQIASFINLPKESRASSPSRPKKGVCDSCEEWRVLHPAVDLSGISCMVCKTCDDGGLSVI